jgi:hypothetical protein
MTVSHKDKEEGDNESHTSDKEEGEKEVLPMSPKGYKLVSIDQETNFVNALQQHAMSCQCQMVVENSSKWGFEVKDSYVCQKCNHRINYRASNDLDELHNNTGGRKKVEMNVALVTSAYIAGMTESTLLQFCAEAGIMSPSPNALDKLWNEVKENVLEISKEQLLENRRKHNHACRQSQNYKGDIVFHDTNGQKHSFARGSIAIDGAGGQRAYSHHIKGTQHALIVFSLVTGDPISVTFSTFRHVFDVPLRFRRSVTFSTFCHVFDVPLRFRRPVTFSTLRHVFDVPLRFRRPVTFSTFRHVFDVRLRFRRRVTFSTFRHVFDVPSRFRRPVTFSTFRYVFDVPSRLRRSVTFST